MQKWKLKRCHKGVDFMQMCVKQGVQFMQIIWGEGLPDITGEGLKTYHHFGSESCHVGHGGGHPGFPEEMAE